MSSVQVVTEAIMKRRFARLALVAALVGLSPACALSMRNPHIAEIQHHPGRYQDHTVAIHGVVTNSWGLPLVPFRMYKVDDGTGEMTVLSENSRMPACTMRSGACSRRSTAAPFIPPPKVTPPWRTRRCRSRARYWA